jgi:hypothetical protein
VLLPLHTQAAHRLSPAGCPSQRGQSEHRHVGGGNASGGIGFRHLHAGTVFGLPAAKALMKGHVTVLGAHRRLALQW